jgi:Pyruvate/2-oxoacid:ferredoxin oxidoreductase delta subunit
MAQEHLYQEMSKLLGAPESSKILPKIIEMIANERECRVLLSAFPAATVAELSEKTGIAREEVQAMVGPMFLKGLLFPSKKEGEPRYYRVKTVPQFHDSSILWKEAPKEFHNLWKEYMAKEWREFGKVIEAFLPRPATRVIPIGAAVESKGKVLAFDDVQQIINQAKVLAVTPCTCRVIDGACGKPVETCIQINRAAEYALSRGTGRSITKQEAMQIIHQAEQEGLVHIADNRQNVDHIICNCCRDCCMNWRIPNPHKMVDPSRFQASVDADACIGCEVCVERCIFDAISMRGDDPKAIIDLTKCVGCGVCTVPCPSYAISLKEVRPPDVVPLS